VTTHPSSNWLDAIRARVSQADIRMVPDSGHFVMLECPQLVADWILETQQSDSGRNSGKFDQESNKQSRRSLT
jgi:hypothetical protein